MMILRKTALLVLAILVCLVPAAFGAETAPSKTTLFVDASWVKENASKLILIDARASALYAKGHIPGAVNAEWTYFANVKGQPGNPGWGEIFPQDTLGKKIGALGIDGKKPIVVYGDCGGWGQEGWAAWVFRLSGIENVRILDGGYNAWLAVGGKASTTAVKPKAVAFTIKTFQGGYKVTTPWLASKLGEIKIVDARTPFEYEGGRVFQERRGGHIPGAINLPWDVVFKADRTVQEVSDLGALFSSYGLHPDEEIAVYDTAGVRAAYLVMVLRMAGYDKARNYDSSFQEWAGTPDLEVVQGNEPGGSAPGAEESAADEPPCPEIGEGQNT
jgi:thiosulfate/3-mercaptopyruvate sulfurtransferase